MRNAAPSPRHDPKKTALTIDAERPRPSLMVAGARSLAHPARALIRASVHAEEPILVVVYAACEAAFLVYGSLVLVAFLDSLEDARQAYAAVVGTKAINWLILAAAVRAGILFRWIKQRQEFDRKYGKMLQGNTAPNDMPSRKYGGVYGKAQPAEDSEIDAALRGKTGGFDGMFED